ncbi:MAG: hypothetical protein WC468_00170 [Candidatus Paceibacterota bacterium]
MRPRIEIIDGICDSTRGKEYGEFVEKYGLNDLEFESSSEVIDEKETYFFTQKDGILYILRRIRFHFMGLGGVTDLWTIAVLKTKESIPSSEYPQILDEVIPWIRENKKVFDE